jgi:hypothetical protein
MVPHIQKNTRRGFALRPQSSLAFPISGREANQEPRWNEVIHLPVIGGKARMHFWLCSTASYSEPGSGCLAVLETETD